MSQTNNGSDIEFENASAYSNVFGECYAGMPDSDKVRQIIEFFDELFLYNRTFEKELEEAMEKARRLN